MVTRPSLIHFCQIIKRLSHSSHSEEYGPIQTPLRSGMDRTKCARIRNTVFSRVLKEKLVSLFVIYWQPSWSGARLATWPVMQGAWSCKLGKYYTIKTTVPYLSSPYNFQCQRNVTARKQSCSVNSFLLFYSGLSANLWELFTNANYDSCKNTVWTDEQLLLSPRREFEPDCRRKRLWHILGTQNFPRISLQKW